MFRQASLVIFIIAGTLELTHLASPLMGQQILPDGSIVISPGSGGDDDSGRIQQAIQVARGTVFFKAGIYKLKSSLRLRSGLTYMGEGGFYTPFGSVLMQTANPDASGLGVPIFTIEGTVSSITIQGLSFFGAAGVNARGIVGTDSNSVLVNSQVRDNSFLVELADCIDTPMISTRIERNGFGNYGSAPSPIRRHIRSRYPAGVPATGDNWIVGNIFRVACCSTGTSAGEGSQSVYFESAVPLHIAGNDFEGNEADTTLRVRSASQVLIQNNWFEANPGTSQMMFINVGNYLVQLEGNWYSMYSCPGSCVLFGFDQRQGPLGTTRVSMAYEAGRNFDVGALSGTELTTNTVLPYLTITGPLFLSKYFGSQAAGHNLWP